MKVLMPGMAPSWRRRSASTFCNGGRSALGFSSTNSRPAFIARRAAADGADRAADMRDIGRLGEHVGDLGLQGIHRLEGNVLARQRRHLQLADILEREEALGDRVELIDRERHRAEKHREHHDVEAEAELERAAIAAKHGVEAALQRAADAAACRRRACAAAGMRDASIGVSVSDTKVDARIETVTTTANSLKIRPMTPPISSTGMNTATSEIEIEMMVKPISREPLSAASNGPSPSSSICRTMFSSMTIASSTTRPTASVSAISEMLSIEKPSRYIAAERRDQRDRHGERRDQRRPDPPQEEEDHQDHQRDGQRQRELDVADRGADRASSGR